jgi:hypothetical protein
LHARTRSTTGSKAVEETVRETPGSPAKHCWVRTPVDAAPPAPGLLLGWRRAEDGRWEGHVVYLAQLRPGRWVTVQEWLAADLLAEVNDR